MANIKITDYDDSYGTRLIIPATVGADTVVKCEISGGWGIKELHIPEGLTSGVEFSGDCSSIIRIIAKDGDCVLSKLAGATFSPKAIVYANSGGSAEAFASDNNIAFVPLGEAPFTPKAAFTYEIFEINPSYSEARITDYNPAFGTIINIPPFIDGSITRWDGLGENFAAMPIIHRITLPNQLDAPSQGTFFAALGSEMAPKIVDLAIRNIEGAGYIPFLYVDNAEFMLFAPEETAAYFSSIIAGLQCTPIEI